MFYRRCVLILLIISALLLPLPSCAMSTAEPLDVLEKIKSAEIPLPAGNIYFSSAAAGEEGYLPPSLAAAMFGGESPEELSLAESYAFFISAGKLPSEFLVFRCYAASDTPSVASLCHARLDALRSYYTDTEHSHYTENATVTIIGKYVIMAVSSDPENAISAAKKAIR